MKPCYLTSVIIFLIVAGLALNACQKDPGSGGTGTIRGKIYGINIRNGARVDSGYVGDIRVFIHYGDNTWADDETRSSYTGDFQFKWLNKGKYKISIISECDTCPMEQTGVFHLTEITEKNQIIDLPDLVGYY